MPISLTHSRSSTQSSPFYITWWERLQGVVHTFLCNHWSSIVRPIFHRQKRMTSWITYWMSYQEVLTPISQSTYRVYLAYQLLCLVCLVREMHVYYIHGFTSIMREILFITHHITDKLCNIFPGFILSTRIVILLILLHPRQIGATEISFMIHISCSWVFLS